MSGMSKRTMFGGPESIMGEACQKDLDDMVMEKMLGYAEVEEQRPSTYKVVWSTEHASGELPYEFVGMDLALQGGREWKAEMVAIDPDPVSAIEEYQWEVVRIDPPLLERNGPEGQER